MARAEDEAALPAKARHFEREGSRAYERVLLFLSLSLSPPEKQQQKRREASAVPFVSGIEFRKKKKRKNGKMTLHQTSKKGSL